MSDENSPSRPPRLPLGRLTIDPVTFAGALARIEKLVEAGKGGTVLTPNVDHVVLVEEEPRLLAAYERADLSLADGTIVVWASRLLGKPLPAKVSGSDLMLPLSELAAKRGFRVYLLGGGPGVAEKAEAALRARFPTIDIVGAEGPRVDVDKGKEAHAEIVARIRAARPDILFVGLGCPKQELFMDQVRDEIAPAVALGIGAGIDFVAGTVPRAPKWVSSVGLEWAYRLSREPRRLWRRYLVRDPKFVVILAREMMGR